ncbi:MAG: twin-arginine translocase subunit TatC [Oligoflexia bacterium]|nr:twin-arginine translocase subunit TatC [Oligoflexia bacterium]MBF0364051.1 twin-arginine translocase subunit TatC [Oligoflexia bacterium]
MDSMDNKGKSGWPWWQRKGNATRVQLDIPMPTTEHLEELRIRLMKIFFTVILFSLLCYLEVDQILSYLSKPIGTMVFTRPAEAFFVRIKLSFYLGLILSIPLIFYQLWGFVSPALKVSERRHVRWLLPLASLLFFAGMLFAYFVVLPVGMNFLLSYQSDGLKALISVNSYISFVGMLLLSFGVVAEMPLIIIFLAMVGIVDDQVLVKKRGVVVVGIFLLAAILTPGPDIFSQLLMAIPMLILFELSIMVTRLRFIKKARFNHSVGGTYEDIPA